MPPGSEGRGIGTALRAAAEARAIERGETLVRQYVAASSEPARSAPARRRLPLRAELLPDADGARRTLPAPPDVAVRVFERGRDDVAVHALVEAAMADVQGNQPRTLESWRAATLEKQGWDPSLWLLHEDSEGLAGVVLCERWEQGAGFVDYLAVAARARGRGLGRALLRHGLTALRGAGMTVAELSVQGENASAIRLYESVGMRPVWTIERWEKPLSPA